MNGLEGVLKTMISEVCGREHEVVGMSFITGSVIKEVYSMEFLPIPSDLGQPRARRTGRNVRFSRPDL